MKIIKKLFGFLIAVVLILFAVYFWNLDQKLMEWAYRRVNEIFDRKKVDFNF